jgi:hypothetical protein
MIDGHGDPNTAPAYAEAVRALYSLAYTLSGRHHEIYLADPRRTAAERLRTILRQPVAPDRAQRSSHGSCHRPERDGRLRRGVRYPPETVGGPT